MARIDTHQLVKELIEGGLPEKPSETIGKAFFSSNNVKTFITKEQFSHLEKEQGNIKTDLAEMKTELKTEIAVIKQTMATKTDLAELKTELKKDIFQIKNDLMKWILPLFLGIAALNISTIGIVVSYIR